MKVMGAYNSGLTGCYTTADSGSDMLSEKNKINLLVLFK